MKKEDFKIDYLGIGTHRAATSWIQQCLIEHPQICGEKELHFLTNPQKCNQGIGLYASFFSRCQPNQIKGEFTPGYLSEDIDHSFIKRYFPNVKFIVCLRNPIERAYSHFLFHKSSEKTSAKTLEEAIEKEPMLKFYYINTGFYYSQLKKYFELYPKENFLILIYEDISKNPLKFIQGIFKFLGVNPNFVPPSVNQQINYSPKNALRIPFLNFYITKLKRFVFSHPKFFGLFVFLARCCRVNKLIEFIRQANVRKSGLERYEKPPLLEKTRKNLRETYQEEIKNLEKLINRDLSFWK